MRTFYAESHFDLDGSTAESAFRALLGDSRLGCTWLAEQNAVPVGYAVLTFRFTMEHGTLSGYIDDLYVAESARRHGIAQALIRALIRECQTVNCKSLCVEVGKDNLPAIGLYRKFGIQEPGDGRVLLSGVC